MTKKFRFKTIWHYAVAFFETRAQLDDAECEVGVKPFYSGEIGKLTYSRASKVAEIHPRCLSYYEAALMPLFKGEGRLSTGTEDPVRAIESLKTQKQSEVDMPYILIWKLM